MHLDALLLQCLGPAHCRQRICRMGRRNGGAVGYVSFAEYYRELCVQATRSGFAGTTYCRSLSMDGLNVSSSNQQAMLEFLPSVFSSIAEVFVEETENLHRFIVRGALAFGPVIHGAEVAPSASNVFGGVTGEQYKNAILLGIPRLARPTGDGRSLRRSGS